MKYRVFVDGQEGTTGLQINERLESRDDIEFLKISAEKRKDTKERQRLINEADIVFLCLPDAAAKEAVTLLYNDKTKIIDASTAHRTNPDWAYGLPELSESIRDRIQSSRLVSVPGCYATGFNLAVYPLVQNGVLPVDYPVTCHAVSGYSGGGKKLIEKYENASVQKVELESPQLYSLGLNHKHLPEMQKISGLSYPPLFSPIVSSYYKGMSVAVPLIPRLLPGNPGVSEIHSFLSDYYKNEYFIKVMPLGCETEFENGFLGAMGCNDTNMAEIYVFGQDGRIMLVTRIDNLGKGSSGAAVQNMNIMLGLDEREGLI
ncbi:MAG TPA: N-acetyl-gamma-glutamyl-phosphate reductase [Clostridia bacterium]